MQSMWEKEGRIEAFLEDPLKALHDVILLIRETPIPFVAAVNGVCAGCGIEFCSCLRSYCRGRRRKLLTRRLSASACRPIAAAPSFLPRAVGEKLAAEFFMTGDASTPSVPCRSA